MIETDRAARGVWSWGDMSGLCYGFLGASLLGKEGGARGGCLQASKHWYHCGCYSTCQAYLVTLNNTINRMKVHLHREMSGLRHLMRALLLQVGEYRELREHSSPSLLPSTPDKNACMSQHTAGSRFPTQPWLLSLFPSFFLSLFPLQASTTRHHPNRRRRSFTLQGKRASIHLNVLLPFIKVRQVPAAPELVRFDGCGTA